tara:strand:- start:6550 stop:8298 length:1749 start_codon:yes stop_codon:yes gene_type:complete
MDKISKVTTNGKRGGNLVGKPHNNKLGKSVGGVKAVVTDAGGRPVELEGGEVIINKEASKKHWKELSKINQSAGNGVPIDKPIDPHDEDPNEFSKGGKIQFNPNKLPNKWILKYAQNIKKNHPEIWKKGGNIYGNQAFKNLERVSERGYWLDSEEWFYIKWQSFVARHKGDFRIAGVVAMLKWVDKVEKGWQYMKNLIEDEIKKIESKKSKSSWTVSKSERMSKGGDVDTYRDKYNRKYGYKKGTSHDLKEIAKDSGVSLKGTQQIYNKGIGAYKTNPQSVRPTVTSKEQWAMARVYSSVMGGKASKVDAKELKMEMGGQTVRVYSESELESMNLEKTNEEIVLEFKKGDEISFNYDSSISTGSNVELEFVSKRRLKSGVVKYTFKNKNNPTGVKFYGYDRGNGLSFAIGDMAISNVSMSSNTSSGSVTESESKSSISYKVGDTGQYESKKPKSIEITKITEKNVYFEDGSGKEKRSEKHNFERLFIPDEFFAPPSSEKSEFVQKANEQIEKWEESGYKEESNEVDYYQILLESDVAKGLFEEEPIIPFLNIMTEFFKLADEERLLSVEQLNNISTTISKYR